MLEPANEYQPYPVHMTQGHPVAYEIDETNWTYRTDFRDNTEHCTLYDKLSELHKRCMRHLQAPVHIEMFWFQDWHLSEEIFKMIPPFHNIGELYRPPAEYHNRPTRFLNEIIPTFSTNAGHPQYQHPLQFHKRPWTQDPSMFLNMSKRLPTDEEHELLIQAHIKKMIDRHGHERPLILKCPIRKMEWIDYHN